MIGEPPGPVARPARIEMLDVARGVAVLGILLMNIWAFGGPQKFFDYPLAIADRAGAPVATWAVIHTLFEGTQRAMLSILFGIGAALSLRRFESHHPAAVVRGIYYRRAFALIGFGLVNSFLFMWPADILFTYGLVSLGLYPLRRLHSRYLLLILLVALAIPAAMRIGEISRLQELQRLAADATAVEVSGAPLNDAQKRTLEDWRKAVQDAQPDAADAEIVADIAMLQQGTLREAFVHQAGVSVILQTIVVVKWWLLDALAGMLIGMLLCRHGWLAPDASAVRFRWLLGAGLVVGLSLGLWQTVTLLASAFDPVQVPVTKLGYDLRRFALALAYLALVVLICRRGALGRIRASLGAVGRMALTNYLAQSIVGALIFYGFGLGLYGKLTGYQLYGVVAWIWALEIAGSVWWLSRFRIGPFEWVWRSLTYRRLQSLGASSARMA